MSILFFARDPGAANALIPLYRALTGHKTFYAKDKARDILERQGIDYQDFNKEVADKNITTADSDVIRNWISTLSCTSIVTGTSDIDDFSDRLIWKLSPSHITTAAVIDQWIRLEMRFKVDDEFYAPQIIFTLSEDQSIDVQEYLPTRSQVITLGHPHLCTFFASRGDLLEERDSIRQRLRDHFQTDFDQLYLYASEARHLYDVKLTIYDTPQQDEIDCYQHILEGLEAVADDTRMMIVKIHPREDSSRYGPFNPHLIQNEFSSQELIVAADVVLGMSSMLLIESVLLGKKVLSFETHDSEYGGLITNRLGLSHPVKSHQDLVTLLSNIEDIPSPSIENVANKLSLGNQWMSIFRAHIHSTS